MEDHGPVVEEDPLEQPEPPPQQQQQQTMSIPVIELEQCGVCSAHYEQGRRTFPQPDVNRMIVKVLDATAPLQADGSSFLNTYIPTCTDCVRKIKRYDKLRLELEVLRREIVSSVVDTLVHIRPNVDTPLAPIKQQVVQKWVSHDGQVGHEPQQISIDHKNEASSVAVAPVRTVSIKRASQPKTAQTTKPRIIRSPPKTAEEALQRQRSFGRKLEPHTTFDVKTLAKASNLSTFSAIQPDDPDNWMNSVSIVAENEVEAQEILAAYVAANIEPEVEAAETQMVEVQAAEGMEEAGFELVGDTYFEADEDFSPGEQEAELEGEDFTGEPEPKKRKRKPKNPDDPNKKRRSAPTKYKKVPQHEKPPFFCENCGRVFLKLGTLRSHAVLCEGREESEKDKPITCPMCPGEGEAPQEPFPDWVALKFHIDEAHSDYHLDKCRFCRKDFLPNTFLGHKCVERLEVMKTDPAFQKFNCSFCAKEYYKMTSLNEHVRRHHAEQSRFRCDVCKRDFSAQVILDRHAKVHTTNVKTPYKCDDCGICVTTVWGLREHKKLHTGERPFACEICGKTFRLYNIKKNHMVVHTKEKNFACELCSTTFTLYATMLRHWKKCRVGPGPKKGKWCPICLSDGSLFLKVKSLQDHMKREHPGTKEQFEICKETGNREFGYEAESAEEVRKLKALRPKRPEIESKVSPKKKTPVRVRVKKEDPHHEGQAGEADANFSSSSVSSVKAKKSKPAPAARRSIRKPKKKANHDDFVDPNAIDSEEEAESILPDDGHQHSDDESPPRKRTAVSLRHQRLIHKKNRIMNARHRSRSPSVEAEHAEAVDSEIEERPVEDAEDEKPPKTPPNTSSLTMRTRHQGLKRAKIVVERASYGQKLRGSKP